MREPTAEPSAAGFVVVRLPPGGVIVRSRGKSPARLGLRRFATVGFPIDAGVTRAGEWATIAIPADASAVPWQLEVRTRSAVEACGAS